MSKKIRIDSLLVDLGYFESRERAKKTLMAGLVFVDGQRVDKAGTKVKEDADILVKGKALKYVSRGGLKLEKAIKNYGLDLTDKICMDVGASTGGFTDCMLQNGATRVYSVDVGYGQLDYKLRNDERVVNMERTNVRYLTEEDVKDKLDFISIDVSFISLKKVIPALKQFMKPDTEMVILIKPQFEAGRANVGKNGVVRDKKVHKAVIQDILSYVIIEEEMSLIDLTYSPIRGPKGNIEFLAYISKNIERGNANVEEVMDLAVKIVEEAHEDLIKKQ